MSKRKLKIGDPVIIRQCTGDFRYRIKCIIGDDYYCEEYPGSVLCITKYPTLDIGQELKKGSTCGTCPNAIDCCFVDRNVYP